MKGNILVDSINNYNNSNLLEEEKSKNSDPSQQTDNLPNKSQINDQNRLESDLESLSREMNSRKGIDSETYTVKRKLGSGSFGFAYEVKHKSGLTIVTKVFNKNKKKACYHEVGVLAQLKKLSERLANNTFGSEIEHVFETENYYCLNLVAGMGTLGDFIGFLRQEKKTLNEQELLFLFEKLFDLYLNLVKLNYAHRDIKSANTILDSKDFSPIFIDYSLAACYGGIKQITGRAGSRLYISPFLEESTITKWELISADLYSLGVTLLEVALPTKDIFSCNSKGKVKLVESQFNTMPIFKKVLKTLLSNSKKKLNIIKKIYEENPPTFQGLDNLLEDSGSDDEKTADNFRLPKNENSSFAEKYLKDYAKFLNPTNPHENQEDIKKESDGFSETEKSLRYLLGLKLSKKDEKDNLGLEELYNSFLEKFGEFVDNSQEKKTLMGKFKNFVSNSIEISRILSITINLQGNLHLLVTILDFISIFLDDSFQSDNNPETQKLVVEAEIIQKKYQSLYDEFIKDDFNFGIKELKNYQLFQLMIGALLQNYHEVSKVKKSQKTSYDIEQIIQRLSKVFNQEILVSYQPFFQHSEFPTLKNLKDSCWNGLKSEEFLYRYTFKYRPESPKPDLIELHIYKRFYSQLECLNTWIEENLEKLQNIPKIFLQLDMKIDEDQKAIVALKDILPRLPNLQRFKLHLVTPLKAEDQNLRETYQYDDFLYQTLEIISCLGSLFQLEMIFDFIYITPKGLEVFAKILSKLRKLDTIELEFIYCPHITDLSVKNVLQIICSSFELKFLAFKLLACQNVVYLDSLLEDIYSIPGMRERLKDKINYIFKPYSEDHSRVEVAGVVGQRIGLCMDETLFLDF